MPAVLSHDDSTTLLKKQIRQQVRAARQALTPLQQQQAAAQLASLALNTPHIQAASRIAVYLTHDGELSTHLLIDALWQAGKQLYLPLLHPFCPGYLLFQRYQPDTPMQTNKFGIAEPKPDVSALLLPAELDMILLPLVAFDAQGQRLGMGGGFYDRTLASIPADAVKPLRVGLAHQCQQVPQVPVERWDLPLPAVMTPEKFWRFR